MRYRPAWLCHSWSVSPAVLSCHLPWVCCPCQREGFITSPCQRTHYFYLPGIGVPLYIVNSCRAFPFIGSHFPYCQDLGFMGSDKEVLQSFHLVVPLFFLSLCYSDLQFSYLTFHFWKVNVLPCCVPFGWRCTLGIRLVPLLFICLLYTSDAADE